MIPDDLIMSDGLPQRILGTPLAPIFANEGSIYVTRTGTKGTTKIIIVPSQKSIKPIVMAIFRFTGKSAQLVSMNQKYPRTPNAAIKFPTTRAIKIFKTKDDHV